MPFQFLLENQRVQCMLMEARLDYLRTRYVPLIRQYVDQIEPDNEYEALLRVLPGEVTDVAEKAFDWLVSLDADPTKKHVQWLLNLYVRNGLRPEDGYKATQYLALFDKVQPRLPVAQRDLNRVRSLNDLFDLIEPYQASKSKREIGREVDTEMHGQAKVLLNDRRYKIVVPLSQAASCHFGINTQWCTAATDDDTDNAFDQYHRNGDLYIILDKQSNQRWQLQSETQQLMDERDREVAPMQFAQAHPEIAKFFQQMDEQNQIAQLENFPVYKTRRGIVAKDRPGLMGTVIAYFTADSDGLLDVFRVRGLDDPTGEQLADLLNAAQMKGSPLRDYGYGFFYRNGRWGSVAQIGDPVAQVPVTVSVTGTWKEIVVPPNGPGDSSKSEFALAERSTGAIDVPSRLKAEAVVVDDSFFLTGGGALALADPDPATFSRIYMPLIKAKSKLIRFWEPQFSTFDSLLPDDQQWLLDNIPTMCTPKYAYDHLAGTAHGKQIVKEIAAHWLDHAYNHPRIRTLDEWIGDTAILRSTPPGQILEPQTAVGSLVYKLGLWRLTGLPDTSARHQAFDKKLRSTPFVAYVDNGKLKKGFKPNAEYVIAIPLKVLVSLLARPFSDYEGKPWDRFLEPALPARLQPRKPRSPRVNHRPGTDAGT